MRQLFSASRRGPKPIIWLLLSGMAVGAAAQAQNLRREKETYQFQEIWQMASGQGLEFRFESLRPDDVVAFGPAKNGTARVLCAVIEPTRLPFFIRPIARGRDIVFRVGESLVEVRREGDHPMFTYADLPRETRLVVRVGDEVVYMGSVRHGVVWADGAWAEAERDLNAPQALARMARRFTHPEVHRSSDPEALHTVPFDRLQRVQYVEPAVARGSGPVRDTLLVELRVDEKGAVEDLRLLRGSEELFDAASGEIGAWRFRPFLVEGNPVCFRTMVLIPVRNAGGASPAAAAASAGCCEPHDR
jgi:hypothetical protein